MAKTLAPGRTVKAYRLRVFLKPYLDKLDPLLDNLFMLRPTLFIPAWIVTAAGLGIGHWFEQRDFFWYVAWNGRIFLLFAGVALIVSAAFARGYAADGGDASRKGYPVPPGLGDRSEEFAGRFSWAGLGLGLLLLLPQGWLAVAGGLALFLVWGLLYASRPALWQDNPVAETALHVLAGSALLIMGWSASGTGLSGGLHFAGPYVLTLAAIGATISMIPGPVQAAEKPPPGARLIALVSAAGTVLLLWAAVWAYRVGDPVISTAAALAIPFFIVASIYRRIPDLVRASRYAILIATIFVGARYPLLFPPIILIFYLSRYYHRRRFGLLHPSLHIDQG